MRSVAVWPTPGTKPCSCVAKPSGSGEEHADAADERVADAVAIGVAEQRNAAGQRGDAAALGLGHAAGDEPVRLRRIDLLPAGTKAGSMLKRAGSSTSSPLRLADRRCPAHRTCTLLLSRTPLAPGMHDAVPVGVLDGEQVDQRRVGHLGREAATHAHRGHKAGTSRERVGAVRDSTRLRAASSSTG